MILPDGVQKAWAVGCMFEGGLGGFNSPCQFRIWRAKPGTGTPVLWFKDDNFMWAYFGAQNPFARSHEILSRQWLERIFTQPSLAQELSGVFALFAVDLHKAMFLAINDRLGVQGVHYGQEETGSWCVSTHLMWLLLAMRHEGSVNDEAFLAHMGFGYTLDGAGVYKGIAKLPFAGYLNLNKEGARRESYWAPPLPAGPLPKVVEVRELAADLSFAVDSTLARKGVVLGLTAGKDSLCLASVLDADESVLAGTFGMPDCADQAQAEQLSAKLGMPHVAGTVCALEDFPFWLNYIAFQSAGLTTASYVDMAAFVGTHVPPGWMFVMGEGGECVRDFFQVVDRQSLETLMQAYMTAPAHLKTTLAAKYHNALEGYPGNLVARAQALASQPDDEAFAMHFYRYQRMSGNFSLRHAVIGTMRARVNPFLDCRFIDKTYALPLHRYENSSLHRAIIAGVRPALLPFFDDPSQAGRTVQEWPARFANGIGATVCKALDDLLPACDDVFNVERVRALCRETISRPSRAIYHLFRVLSFAEARRLLRFEAQTRLAAIPQLSIELAVKPNVAPLIAS